ncbi:MAG: uroporphyrinogen decarboxylase family protein, partial [Candidatus Hodarchaeales archaeon]
MNSLERVLATMQHEEPDKVPIFLLLTIQGAKILDIPIKNYFSSGVNVAKGQLKLQSLYGHDCLYPFFYAAKEVEAFGGTVIEQPQGPPEAGKPPFRTVEDLLAYENPEPTCKVFEEIIIAQQQLFEAKGTELPILNAVVAPLSLGVLL